MPSSAHPKPVATFVISDVPGDDVGAIASGPTVPDPTTQAEALRILEKYRYPAVRELGPILGDPQWETPKPGDPKFAGDSVHLIATAATALAAAARFLEQQGFDVVQLGDDLDDEAQALGREHARLAKSNTYLFYVYLGPVPYCCGARRGRAPVRSDQQLTASPAGACSRTRCGRA